MLYAGRGIGFFYDEWNWVLERREGTLDSYLKPHNEHFSLLPVIVYKALFATVGVDPHWPYRLPLVAVHLLTGALVYALARRRVGDWAAVIAAAAVLFLGQGWENLIWAFQVGFVGSIAAGLAALLALERGRDALAGALLLASLACASLGVTFLVGAAVELAWQRRGRRLWPAVVAPGAVFAVWYAGYGESAIKWEGIVNGLNWSLDSIAAAFGGLFGQGSDWGVPIALAGIAALLWRLGSTRPVTPRLAALVAAAGAFWLLSGFARSTGLAPANSPRYLYVGAVFIVLIACELLAGVRLRPRAVGVAAAVAAVAIAMGLPVLREHTRAVRATTDRVAAGLAAVELLGDHADPAYQVAPKDSPQIVVGPYLAAVRGFGESPAADLEAVGGAPLAEADRVLAQAGGLRVDAAEADRCEPGAVGEQELPTGGVTVQAGDAPVTVRVRRLHTDVGDPVATVEPGAATRVVPMPDRGPAPWHVRVEGQACLR
jgi:hypothetical protein